MNKEILDKLKFQAAAQVSPLLEGSEWQQVYSEKFAELIVAECIDVFSKDLPEDSGKMLEVVNRVCNVAEHFGVEK